MAEKKTTKKKAAKKAAKKKTAIEKAAKSTDANQKVAERASPRNKTGVIVNWLMKVYRPIAKVAMLERQKSYWNSEHVLQPTPKVAYDQPSLSSYPPGLVPRFNSSVLKYWGVT